MEEKEFVHENSIDNKEINDNKEKNDKNQQIENIQNT